MAVCELLPRSNVVLGGIEIDYLAVVEVLVVAHVITVVLEASILIVRHRKSRIDLAFKLLS